MRKERKADTSMGFFPRVIREFEDDDEPMVYGTAKNTGR